MNLRDYDFELTVNFVFSKDFKIIVLTSLVILYSFHEYY